MYLIWLIRQDVLIVKLLQNSGDNLDLQKGCYISICDSLKHRNFEILLNIPFLSLHHIKQNYSKRIFFNITNIFSISSSVSSLSLASYASNGTAKILTQRYPGVFMIKWKEMKNCWKSVQENATQLESIARSGCRSVIPHVSGGKGKKLLNLLNLLNDEIYYCIFTWSSKGSLSVQSKAVRPAKPGGGFSSGEALQDEVTACGGRYGKVESHFQSAGMAALVSSTATCALCVLSAPHCQEHSWHAQLGELICSAIQVQPTCLGQCENRSWHNKRTMQERYFTWAGKDIALLCFAAQPVKELLNSSVSVSLLTFTKFLDKCMLVKCSFLILYTVIQCFHLF